MNHFKIPVALGTVQTLSQYQQLARKLKAYLVTQNMYVKQIFLYRYHAISTNVRIFQINKNYLLSSIYHDKFRKSTKLPWSPLHTHKIMGRQTYKLSRAYISPLLLRVWNGSLMKLLFHTKFDTNNRAGAIYVWFEIKKKSEKRDVGKKVSLKKRDNKLTSLPVLSWQDHRSRHLP